ncbi:hypothetical protein SADUNF_Sadunf02G0018000 [Salix dunnii]|uniref:Uncharacterized protein n=1 Tax=Salix dunnii TaxID=1413687 RepID=A0A835N5S0_9ROSI|nr:hypothetical protein SADUNF_Sadunf02G0018000 [Salix dunnii]
MALFFGVKGIVMFLEVKIIKEQNEVFVMMEHRGRRERKISVFCTRMMEQKENGIWEKENAEVQFLGGAVLFAARSIVKPRQQFAQQVMKDARGSSRPSMADNSNRRQMVHKETKTLRV